MTRLFLLCLLMSSCSTTIYYPNGKPKFRTYGDSASVTYQDKTTTLQVTDLNHSVPTRNAMTGVNGIVAEVAAAALTGGAR